MAAANITASTARPQSTLDFSSRPGGQPTNKTIGAKNRSSTPGAIASTNPTSKQSRSTLVSNPQRQSTCGPASKCNDIRALDDKVLRAGFLRKVYGMLTMQMIVTVGVASICMFTPTIRDTFVRISQSQTWWLKLAFLIPTVTSLLLLSCGAKANYPANYVLLLIFTLGMSAKIGYICAVFQAAGYGYIVLQAFSATAIIFTGLTMYTLYSGKDFSYMGGFLTVALWGLVLTGLVGLFFPGMVPSLAIGFVGALTFCGYILYDTWRLQKQFSYDDYIGATIELYLDILNLFLYILQILVELQEGGKQKKKN